MIWVLLAFILSLLTSVAALSKSSAGLSAAPTATTDDWNTVTYSTATASYPASWASITAQPTGAADSVSKRDVDDDFSTAPEDLNQYEVGAIIRSREVTPAWLSIIPLFNVKAYQVLYRTSAVSEEDTMAAVATIFVPDGAATGKLVVFGTAEDSASDQCAPSLAYSLGGSQENLILPFEELIVMLDLAQGWTVVVPDYEGPDSGFAAGFLEGHAMLDSIRAATSFGGAGLSSDAKVVIHGYSGGAMASGWAAALQPTYAPDLNVVGVAAGGTPANLSGTLQYLDGTLFSGLGFAGLAGLSNVYTDVQARLDEVLTDEGMSALSTSRSQCAVENLSDFLFATLQSDEYSTLGPDLLYDSVLYNVLRSNDLANSSRVPTAPLYVTHALYDEVIPIDDAEVMIDTWCDAGIASLQYLKDVGLAEHLSMEILSLVPTIKWMSDRLDGTAATPGCSTEEVTTTELLLQALVGLTGDSQAIMALLFDMMLAQIGTDDALFQNSIQSAA